MLHFVLGNRKARQMRNAAHGVGVHGHYSSSSLESAAQKFRYGSAKFSL
jgi:hypothetical protein